MRKLINYAFMAIVLSAGVTSCGKDDDNEPAEDGTLMPIPVSIVDGVRVSSVTIGDTDFSKFVYNSDGSVASATINGVNYDFEYASTRASVEYTDSKLVRIKIRDEEGSVSAYGFMFDDKTGFATQWSESREYREESYYEKTTTTFTPIYNSEGRISELKYSGRSEWNDPEEGKGSESGSGIIHYNYQGSNLVSSTHEIPDEGMSVFSLGYSGGPLNAFNIAPYPLYYVMGHGELSLVSGVLAHLGYLGFPSSYLPTSFSYRVDDYVDMEATMSYNTNSVGRVTSIDMSIDGRKPFTLGIGYLR